MPFLEVAGLRCHYVHRRPVQPSKPPVVFIHGAGGTHQNWLYQVRDLPGLPSYALDLPGHGRSQGPGRDSIFAYSDWLVSLLDAAELDSAVLVGHSMGGAIALDTALRFPERVAGLGLVATGARLRVAPAVFEAIHQGLETAVALVCQWAFGPEAPPGLVRLGRRQMRATPAEVLHGDFVACDGFDVMSRVGQIAVPAVVVCGTQDVMTPLKYSTYLRDQIRGAELYLVEGAGHMVMVENPDAVARALADLVERVPARRAGEPGPTT